MSQAATSPCMKLLNRVPACVAAPCLCCSTLSWLSWRAHTSGILCLHLPHHPPARIPFSAVFLLLFVVRRRRATAQAEAEANKQSVDITALRQGRLTMQTEGEEEQQQQEEEEEGLGPLAGNRHRVSMLAAAQHGKEHPSSIHVLPDFRPDNSAAAAHASPAAAATAISTASAALRPPLRLPGEASPVLPSSSAVLPFGSGSPADASLGATAAANVPRKTDMELEALELAAQQVGLCSLVCLFVQKGSNAVHGWQAHLWRGRGAACLFAVDAPVPAAARQVPPGESAAAGGRRIACCATSSSAVVTPFPPASPYLRNSCTRGNTR